MGGGGTAPAMKMSDVFILTGLTLLLGGLFMHAWVSPIDHGAEDPPYTNGASMMKGDAFDLRITVEEETTLRIVLKDDTNAILSAESFVLAAGALPAGPRRGRTALISHNVSARTIPIIRNGKGGAP